MNLDRKTHEQDVVAAKSQLASLKADYMSELTTYMSLTEISRWLLTPRAEIAS